MQEFNVNKKIIISTKIGFVFFGVLIVLSFMLPFLPEEGNTNIYVKIITSTILIIVFGFFTITAWSILKKIPYSDIVTDNDGIWYKYLGKAKGLISWEQISQIKERELFQRLELLDKNGVELLRVEYQLVGFDSLRDILSKKIFQEGPELNRTTYTKGLFHHLFYIASIIGFTAMELYIVSEEPKLGYVVISFFIVLFIVYEYAVTATGIKITSDSFIITYPMDKKNIPFSEVTDILLIDDFHKGSRIPMVWIVSNKFRKPFELKELGVDSIVLHSVLQRAIQKRI